MTKNALQNYLNKCTVDALRADANDVAALDKEISDAEDLIKAIDINLEREKIKEA
ncbi:MAG TPA: hypothetical protein PL124_05480 [Candidatus Cloacimonadota bacterium]|nr:hypothetical protein [Candidatus Cloacimonadota bacterium]HPS38848.1 hypothetical protein [Candidatus Cloacimonadota bacterium]